MNLLVFLLCLKKEKMKKRMLLEPEYKELSWIKIATIQLQKYDKGNPTQNIKNLALKLKKKKRKLEKKI